MAVQKLSSKNQIYKPFAICHQRSALLSHFALLGTVGVSIGFCNGSDGRVGREQHRQSGDIHRKATIVVRPSPENTATLRAALALDKNILKLEYCASDRKGDLMVRVLAE